jgi:hypothetical protein
MKVFCLFSTISEDVFKYEEVLVGIFSNYTEANELCNKIIKDCNSSDINVFIKEFELDNPNDIFISRRFLVDLNKKDVSDYSVECYYKPRTNDSVEAVKKGVWLVDINDKILNYSKEEFKERALKIVERIEQ